MNQTPNTIHTTFEESIQNLAKSMNESYTHDENGGTLELDADSKAQIDIIVANVTEKATDAFKELFDQLVSTVEEQRQQLEQLEKAAQAAEASSIPLCNDAVAIAAIPKVVAASSEQVVQAQALGELPTVEWLKANRKSKKDGALTGYNCFTMFYMAKHKNGFPTKGTWEKQDQAAFKAIAAQYNAETGAKATRGSAAKTASAPSTINVEGAPKGKGMGKAITAFNIFTQEYMKKNPGAGFPPKGLWAQVPKAEVARYQEMAKALQTARA